MNCPVCSKEMVQEDYGQKVYVCENGCKGIWFDHIALQNLDQNNEGVGESLKAALNYPRVNDENRAQIKCPKCNLLMHIHKYERSQEVKVDECYQCGGFFLDSGELANIRNKAMSDQEVDAYVAKLVDDIPVCHQERVLEKEGIRVDAAQNFGKLLKANYWK